MPDINMQVFEEAQRNQLVTGVDIQTQVALEDYQVQLSDIANPTQSQDNVAIDRFGEFLPHWNESLDFDTWIKMSMEVAGKRLLVLSGNSNMSSASNGDDTFEFFDDFPGSSIDTDKWTIVGSPSVANNILTVPPSSAVTSKVAFTEQVIIKADIKNSKGIVFGLSESTVNASITSWSQWFGAIYHRDADNLVYGLDIDGWGNNIYTIAVDGSAYHKFEAFYGTYLSYYRDDIYKGIGDISATIGTEYVSIMDYGNGGITGYAKTVFVRKYTATKPTWMTDGEGQNIVVALKSLGRAG